MTRCCPHCHMPLSVIRAGVRMTVLKANIFDAIVAAGEIGISSRELIEHAWDKDRRKPNYLTVKAHVQQINELLAETDIRIVSMGRRRWHVPKPRKRRAEAKLTDVPAGGQSA